MFSVPAIWAILKTLLGGFVSKVIGFVKTIVNYLGVPGIVGICVSLFLFGMYHDKYVHPRLIKVAEEAGRKAGILEERAIWEKIAKDAKDAADRAKKDAEIQINEISKRHSAAVGEILLQNAGLEDAIKAAEEEIRLAELNASQAEGEVQTLKQDIENAKENTSQPRTVVVTKTVNGKCTTVISPVLSRGVVRELNKIKSR